MDLEGKIIGKDGKEIEGRFPSWGERIPGFGNKGD